MTSAVILFAQPPNNGAVAPSQQFNNRNFPNLRIPPDMWTTLGRSYSNALDKGLMGSLMIFEGSRKEELRNSLEITDVQLKEIETLRTAAQMRLLTKIPDLIKRFNDKNENNLQAIQTDIETDIQKFIDKMNSITTPEQQSKAKEFVFQVTGGLNSPFIGKDTLDLFNFTEEQREKAELIIEQARAERDKKIEDLLKLFGERNKKDITRDEINEIRKKREALFAEIIAIGKKTGDRLKGFLNEQQRKKAEDLIANTPKFLPKLPGLNRNSESPYIPNPDSWKPGQGVPDDEKKHDKTRKIFPRQNSENKE
jgi:hypothetical protein